MNLHTQFEAELVLVCGADRASVLRECDRLLDLLAKDSTLRLQDIAWTYARRYTTQGRCLAIVASSLDDLAKKLRHAAERLAKPETVKLQDRNGIFYQEERFGEQGKVAFLFPGEGAQYPNMLKDLCLHFPEALDAFDQVDRACERAGDGFVPSKVIFPAPGTGSEGDDGALFEMEGAVEAVVSANTALTRIFQKLQIKPDAVVGHSSGEFMALEAAGIFRFKDADERIQRICDGYLLMKEMTGVMNLPQGTLITVGGVEREVIDGLLAKHPKDLLVAMDNCPHQVVLCARPALAAELVEFLGSEGAIASPLPFERPYHTPWFEPALDGLRAFFRKRPLYAPEIPTYSCASADLFPSDGPSIESLCVSQWGTVVRFRETIERMHERGFRLFVEVGPRGNLTSFVDDILKGKSHVAIPSNRIHKSGLVQLQHAIGQLAAHGVAMNLDYLHERRGSKSIDDAVVSANAGRKPMLLSSAVPEFAVAALEVPAREFRAPVPGSPVDPDRDAAFLTFFDSMDQFLDAQREMIEKYLGPLPVASEADVTAGTGYPLLTEFVEYRSGESLVALGRYDAENEVFVKDHTLGTVEVSVLDPTLTGIPIMPMTCSLEILSEAASALVPGKRVVGLRDIRATRWISFDEGHATIRINAKVLTSGDRVEVRAEIRDHVPDDPRAAFKPSLVEATVVLGDAYAPAPAKSAWALDNPVSCNWVGDALYPDRLFHGPRMSGIKLIRDWAKNGVTGSVEVLPRNDLIVSHPEPAFAMDPVLLDSVGAVLNMWGAFKPFDGIVFFPVRIEEVRFHAPLLPEGTKLDVQLRITGKTELTSIADIEAFDAHGRVLVSVKAWEDRTFDITPVLHRMFLRAADSFVSDEIASPEPETVCCMTQPIPIDLLQSSHRIWQKMLAFLVLDRQERERWKNPEWTEKKRIDWLLGRAVAKDAVRRYLAKAAGLRLASPDIHLAKDESGKLRVTGPWMDLTRVRVTVSLAHADGRAVAIVGSEKGGELGIDLEPVREVSAEFLQGALSESEQSLLPVSGDGRSEVALRIWCAKEAASKALGVGIRFDPRDLRATSVDSSSGCVTLSPGGDWANVTKDVTLTALTSRRENCIMAVSISHIR